MSSSPFEIFRRNLKPLMVLLTILALFSFVFLPALDTYMRRGGGVNSDPVAATFDGADLTRNQVGRTTQNHAAVVRMLNELADETMKRGGVPQTPGFQYDEQSGQIRSLGIDSNPSAEATVNTLRFYSEATKAGFELDDTSVAAWLNQFTDGTVSDDEIAAMMIRSSGRQLGQQHLYEQLRMHLLADLYQRGFLVGLTNNQMPVVTPLGQYQNFLKLNQKITVQTYAVLVSEYVDQTDENPSQSDMEEVYEEGGKRLSYPDDQSPLPSFLRPDAAKIEFVGANLQQFIDAEKAKLSEEQIRAEYERRLAGGDFQLPIDAAMEAATDAATEETPDAAEAAEPTEPGEPTEPSEAAEPAAEDSSFMQRNDTSVQLVVFQDEETGTPETPAEPATPETPAKPETPADAKPADAEPADAEPATDKPAEVKEEPAADTETPETQPEMKEQPPAETEPEPTTEEAPADEPATEEPATEENAAEENATEENATEENAAEEKPMKETPAEETPATETPMEPPATTLDFDDEPAPTRPQTFEEVRDQIATEMASEPARGARDRAVTEANKRMRQYFSKLAVHESNIAVGVDTEADAPKPLDMKAMAAELGMVFGRSEELVNRFSVSDIGPGQSDGLSSGFNRRGPPYGSMMFGGRMQDGSELSPQPIYSPLRSVDLEAGMTYISWKTEDVPSYLPELDEVLDEVVEFIRTREAQGLAQAAAEKLAAEVGKDDQSLAEVIPEDKTDNFNETVGPFSWLEQVGFMQTVVSEVPQLDAVGEDFMRAVFTTSAGKTSVAANDAKSVYYVVRPIEFQPEVEQLREQFRQPQQRFMAQMLGNSDARNLLLGVYESVDERTGFEMKLSEDE